MKNIVLIGAPGSGKGTQGDFLKNEFNLHKIALGDILRLYRKNKEGHLSEKINELLDSGKLLPDEIVNAVAEDFIKKNIQNYNSLMFDGYPRSVCQAKFLDEMLAKSNTKIDTVIMLDIKLESLIERLQNRYTCVKCGAIYNRKTHKTKIKDICDECGSSEFIIRKDDGEISVIQTRFIEFQEKTIPVIEYYKKQNKLISINALGEIEDVNITIMKVLDLII